MRPHGGFGQRAQRPGPASNFGGPACAGAYSPEQSLGQRLHTVYTRWRALSRGPILRPMTTTGQPAPPAEDHAGDHTLAALRRALGGTHDVERLLGAGGMGSVYLGHDRALDRAVAIKVIAPELAATAALRERFLREARTVARLRHPNIVAVYSAGETEGVLYFVMEYVPGESLRDRLDRAGRYDDASAVAALRDLARALAYAHGQGIIHRDVKPENVLLDAETGRAMLMDFGVAGAMRQGSDERMTGTGFVVGSPRYMSPEQAAGERDLDGRSDLYSLGLVGYEMLAGEPAVAGGSAASIIMRQITERPAPLTTRNDHVPPAVAAIVPGTWLLLGRGGAPHGVDPRKSYLVVPFDVITPDPQLSSAHPRLSVP